MIAEMQCGVRRAACGVVHFAPRTTHLALGVIT